MGRIKGYKLSDERIKRMRLAKERRKKGITKHLYVVEILVEDKMQRLFKEWRLDIEDFWFDIDPYDRKDFIDGLGKKNLRFEPAVKFAVECLENMKVEEVALVCMDNQILKVTGDIGNIVHIKRQGKEYFVSEADGVGDWRKTIKKKK